MQRRGFWQSLWQSFQDAFDPFGAEERARARRAELLRRVNRPIADVFADDWRAIGGDMQRAMAKLDAEIAAQDPPPPG